MTAILERIDRFQQRHAWLGFPFAVFRRFSEDRAGNLAALIAYYAFFSIFPLLLALVTILGYVLGGNESLRQQVLSSALKNFPLLKPQDIGSLSGNAFALVVGLLLALWSGLSVANTAQQAFNTVHDVAKVDFPGFVPRLVRSLELIGIVGGGLVVTTLLQGALSGAATYGLDLGVGVVVLGAVVGVILNTIVFVYAFRRLTVRELGWSDVFPGAVITAVAWFVLQKVGTSLLNNKVNGAQGTYGTFAVVIGLLFWFYLLAQITLYCAEINVVRIGRLWPRGLKSMSSQATTDADRRAYESYPQRERQSHGAEVDVRVGTDPGTDSPTDPSDLPGAVPDPQAPPTPGG